MTFRPLLPRWASLPRGLLADHGQRLTMNGLQPIFGAGLAVALLVLLAARLGFRGAPQLAGPDEARQIAATLHGGFKATDLALDEERRGALLADAQGRVALVAAFGAHFIAREMAQDAVIERRNGELSIMIDGLRVRLELGSAAPAWQARIARTGGPR